MNFTSSINERSWSLLPVEGRGCGSDRCIKNSSGFQTVHTHTHTHRERKEKHMLVSSCFRLSSESPGRGCDSLYWTLIWMRHFGTDCFFSESHFHVLAWTLMGLLFMQANKCVYLLFLFDVALNIMIVKVRQVLWGGTMKFQPVPHTKLSYDCSRI